MRILALLTDAFGGYGGIAQYNRDLVAALARLPGVGAVEVLPRLAAEPPGPLPQRVRQRPAQASRAAYAASALVRALATRPRLVVGGHLYHAGLARRVAALVGAPMASVVHGTEVWGNIAPRRLAGLAASARVLCASADTAARVVAAAPALAGRTAVTYNTLGEAFRPGDRAAARARFGLAGTAILTVARLDGRAGYKGHDRIIARLPALPRGTVYLIAGVGPDEGRLRHLAAAAGVAERVRFLGKVAAADLPDLYRAADLFALPSTGEGFGIVYLEAMGCGTPAIGLAVGGAPDALGHGTLGTVADPLGFPAALDAALAAAAAMDTAARALLSQRVHALFGRDAFCARVAAALEPLLGG